MGEGSPGRVWSALRGRAGRGSGRPPGDCEEVCIQRVEGEFAT